MVLSGLKQGTQTLPSFSTSQKHTLLRPLLPLSPPDTFLYNPSLQEQRGPSLAAALQDSAHRWPPPAPGRSSSCSAEISFGQRWLPGHKCTPGYFTEIPLKARRCLGEVDAI